MADFGDFNIELDHNKVADAERAQKQTPKISASIPSYSQADNG